MRIISQSLNPYNSTTNFISPFRLLPIDPIPPYIREQPINTVTQNTWLAAPTITYPSIAGISANSDTNPPALQAPIITINYQKIVPKEETVRVLVGTSLQFGVEVDDNSISNNPNMQNPLTYVWKKDGNLLEKTNRLNSTIVSISSTSCTQEATGVYTCEVSNIYGTTVTDPLTIEVINPFEHPKLYKNLITNGKGEGGLAGWEADSDIKVSPFTTPKFDQEIAQQFNSFNIGGIETEVGRNTPPEFQFSIGSHFGMFHRLFKKRQAINPDFGQAYIKGTSAGSVLTEHERWYSEGASIPQIIPNEDYDTNDYGTPAGFFPGLAWIDSYNKNNTNKIIGLSQEYADTTLPFYFTRDKIKFVNKGGKAETSLTQTIDLSDVADIIDGNAYGVTHATGQFFAYVGAGITDYKIKYQEDDKVEPTTTNYYVADFETYKYEFQEAWRDDPSLDYNVYYGFKGLDANGAKLYHTQDTSTNGTGSTFSRTLASVSPSNLYSQTAADAKITKLNEIIQYYYMRFLDKDRGVLQKFSKFTTASISADPVPIYFWYWYSDETSARWVLTHTDYPNRADSNAPLPFKAEYTTSSLSSVPGTGTYNYTTQMSAGIDSNFRPLHNYYGDIQTPSATNIIVNTFIDATLDARQKTLRTIGRFIADDLYQPWYMLRRIFDEAKDYLQSSDVQAVLGANFANDIVDLGNHVRNNLENEYARKKDIIKTNYEDGRWEKFYHINDNGTSDAETHATNVIVPKMYEMFDLLHNRYIAMSKARDLLVQEIEKVQWIRQVESAYYRATQEKKQHRVKRFTDIEIQPKVYDKTRIELTYYNAQNTAIRTETINGPDEQDVWAIKEKTFFPLTLYPVFQCLNTDVNFYGTTQAEIDKIPAKYKLPFLQNISGMPYQDGFQVGGDCFITVFGQEYTSMRLLGGISDRVNQGIGSGIFEKGINSLATSSDFAGTSIYNAINAYTLDTNILIQGPYTTEKDKQINYTEQWISNKVSDKNANFLMNNYDFAGYGGAYPPNNSNFNKKNSPIHKTFTNNAVYDFGAAAMFGVGITAIIPRGARSVQIKVIFEHTSDVIYDSSPETKNWKYDEIYSNLFGQKSNSSARTIKYGNPRCGITNMKYVIAANNFEETDRYPSYNMPPPQSTVLGLEKEKYNIDDFETFFTAATANTAERISKISNLTLTLPPTPTVIENLYTAGGEYALQAGGEVYVGYYHIHNTKGPMVGRTHTDAFHDYLYPIESL